MVVSLFFTDLLYGVLPDEITLSSLAILVLLKLVISVSNLWLLGQATPVEGFIFNSSAEISWNLILNLIAMVGLFTFFWAFYYFSKGRAMGDGDMRLGVLMGIFLGRTAWLGFFLSFFIGALVATILLLTKNKKFGQSVPLAPFLVVGSLIAFYWSGPIIGWYQQYF